MPNWSGAYDETYCSTEGNKRNIGGLSDRDAKRLIPGDVAGLCGYLATFSLGCDDGLGRCTTTYAGKRGSDGGAGG